MGIENNGVPTRQPHESADDFAMRRHDEREAETAARIQRLREEGEARLASQQEQAHGFGNIVLHHTDRNQLAAEEQI